MASLVIPGININEIDQTTSTPNVSSTTGAVVGILIGLSYKWGIKKSLFSRSEPTA
jgi:hypothetical protein